MSQTINNIDNFNLKENKGFSETEGNFLEFCLCDELLNQIGKTSCFDIGENIIFDISNITLSSLNYYISTNEFKILVINHPYLVVECTKNMTPCEVQQ